MFFYHRNEMFVRSFLQTSLNNIYTSFRKFLCHTIKEIAINRNKKPVDITGFFED